jgi:DeoR family transcriptional regulator, fructose operon transcriptional repressor
MKLFLIVPFGRVPANTAQQKQAIASAAMEYIQDEDTVILDAGTTTFALIQLLKEQLKSAFIITCSVSAALELSSAGYDILLLGGIVRIKSLALLGRETLTVLEHYRANNVKKVGGGA